MFALLVLDATILYVIYSIKFKYGHNLEIKKPRGIMADTPV